MSRWNLVLLGACLCGMLLGTLPARAQEDLDDLVETSEQDGEADARIWRVFGRFQFRTLAISDEDPANDRYILWNAGGRIGIPWVEGLFGTAVFGLTQEFYPEPDESSVQLQDTLLAVGYEHSIPTGLEDRPVSFTHRLATYLPTSRISRAQDLILAPQWLTEARFSPVHRLTTGIDFVAQYQWHEYAERAGLNGGMNTRLALAADLVLGHTVVKDETYGAVSVLGRFGSQWYLKYPSRDDHLSDTSDQSLWLQGYSWSLSASYTPIEYATVALSLEHAGNVLRNGVVNTFFGHRDETELVLTVLGRY